MKLWMHRCLLLINVLIATGLLATAFLPYINPSKSWICGFAGFFFPVFGLLAVLSLIVHLIFYRDYAWIPFIALLASVPPFLASFAFHPFAAKTSGEPAAGQIRIMSFNCSSMGLKDYKIDEPQRNRILQMIRENPVDVLCLQEFYTNDDPTKSHHLDSIMKYGGFRYVYQTKDLTRWNTWHFGLALFSKYPILDTAKILTGAGPESENLLKARIRFGQETLTIFNTHLYSYSFDRSNYQTANSEQLHGIRGLIRKMKATFSGRVQQAMIVKENVHNSDGPTILCGDLNAIPNSFVYKSVKGDFQDAFLKKGFGWGTTFHTISPFLRIDYIFCNPGIRVQDFRVLHHLPFEHYPIITTIEL